MNTLIKRILDSGYSDCILTEGQVASPLEGSDQRRYGLVNRALKEGSLLRLKRGLYTLSSNLRSGPIHPYAIAQAIPSGSYISMETALSYHGWIPEAVYETVSVTSGRKTLKYQHEAFGQFTYFPLALNKYKFLQSVKRHKAETQIVLIADPLRALMDLVAYRKVVWTSMGWLENGLRIDTSHLLKLSLKDFDKLKPVYKHKSTQFFLESLKTEIIRAKKNLRNAHD
jgi:hypothetical protein